jgi:hypothetical protein
MTRFVWSRRLLPSLGVVAMLAAATAVGMALSRPAVAHAACTDSNHAGALVPSASVGHSVTVRVWTDTNAPVGGSADIIRPNGSAYGSVYLQFGPRTPGGYYFAPVTWTPGTSGTWKVKYSISMDSCNQPFFTQTTSVPVS